MASACRPGAALFLCLFLTGCGSPGVSGTVTLDGQPVDGGTIALFPTGGGGAGAPTGVPGEIKGGKYTLSAENLKPGEYRVEIYWYQKTGKQVENKNDPGTKVDETKQVIPDEYNRSTTLKVEVKSGSTTADFALKSGGVITSGSSGSPGKGPSDETQPGKTRPKN